MPDDKSPSYPVSRETLYELAWSEPMTNIAKVFDVSSSYLARLYTQLNVPRPAPGYWAKIAAGKPVKIPPLPEPDMENAAGWDRYNSLPFVRVELRPSPPKNNPIKARPSRAERPDIHPLIRGAKEHFLKSKSSDIGYLRPYKRQLVDLTVSDSGLDQALSVANSIFLALEDQGYRVAHPSTSYSYRREPVDERAKPDNRYRLVNHWSPSKGTLVYVGTVVIGLSLFEVSESVEVKYVDGKYIPVANLNKRAQRIHNSDWTTHRDLPTGRFCLQAYSPYQETSWKYQWQISADADLTKFGRNLARELAIHAETVAAEAALAQAEAERRRAEHEEKWRLWQIEEENRKRKEANAASHQQLMHIIDRWNELKRIAAFFEEANHALTKLPQEDQVLLRERIQLAENMIGPVDALKELERWQTPSEILEHKKSRAI